MTNLVEFLKSIIDRSFWEQKIEDRKCKIDISNESQPNLVIKFDPLRPNFGKKRNSDIKFPDFVFASDYPDKKGRLFIIELSKGKSKSRRYIEGQLSSGFHQLYERMTEMGIETFNYRPLLRAIYYGPMNSVTIQEIRKKPIKIFFFGKPVKFVPLNEENSLDDAC